MDSSLQRLVLVSVSCAFVAGVVEAQVPDPKIKQGKMETPRFSWQHLNPPELQFSCAGTSNAGEEKCAKLLEKGEPHQQLAAARELWEGHSRRQASNVLKYLASLRRAVKDSVSSSAKSNRHSNLKRFSTS